MTGATRTLAISLACASMLVAPAAHAWFVIDFDELGTFDNAYDFYSGGFNNAGMQGPDLGVLIGGAYTFNHAGNTFISYDDGFSGKASVQVSDGFTSGFAFNYTSMIDINMTVKIWNSANELLATQTVFIAGTGIFDEVGNWRSLGLAFAGEATLVTFGDDHFDGAFVFLDNFTIGRATLIPVPGAWMLLLSAGAALRLLHRKK